MAKIVKDDVDRFFDYDVSISTRTIFMGSVDFDGENGVNERMVERVTKALHIMDQSEGNITIFMNNPGGDYYSGFAIYDAIRERKNHVTIKVYGYAMSMGALILQAADDRVLSPNSRVMIHYGYSNLNYDHAITNEKWADQYKKDNVIMEDILLARIKEKHPRFTRKKVKELLKFDTILSPREAIDLGLADRIEGE